MKSITFGVISFYLLWIHLFKNQKNYSRAVENESGSCNFPAIFNFGDSNSDTTSESTFYDPLPSPYGQTFFGKPSGRYSDGRLMIDFIAEKLGFPFLSAYEDSNGSNFTHGANFAVSGSTIQRSKLKLCSSGFNPFTFEIQILRLQQLKAWSSELHEQDKNGKFPKPEDFSRALYIMDGGQNDLDYGLRFTTEKEIKKVIPNIIDQFTVSVEQLYEKGARAFWIHNTGPIGCLPYLVGKFPPIPGNADQNGCIKSFNELAKEFNKHLKDSVSKLRNQYPDAVLVYVHLYSAKYSLISRAKDYGFVDHLVSCCGRVGVSCGKKATRNGTQIFGAACENPSAYINWDGKHYTEAANKLLANQIMNGLYSDPQVSITQACPKQWRM